MNEQTLGQKLKKTLHELEQAEIKRVCDQYDADLEKVRKERKEIQEWSEKIKDLFVDQINNEKVPHFKVSNYDRKKWIKDAISANAKHQDIWDDFRQYWKSEGLEVKITDEHDGMGMKEWITITLTVLPDRPRSQN